MMVTDTTPLHLNDGYDCDPVPIFNCTFIIRAPSKGFNKEFVGAAISIIIISLASGFVSSRRGGQSHGGNSL